MNELTCKVLHHIASTLTKLPSSGGLGTHEPDLYTVIMLLRMQVRRRVHRQKMMRMKATTVGLDRQTQWQALSDSQLSSPSCSWLCAL